MSSYFKCPLIFFAHRWTWHPQSLPVGHEITHPNNMHDSVNASFAQNVHVVTFHMIIV